MFSEVLTFPKPHSNDHCLKLNTARRQALSAIFLFHHRYRYNPYISSRPLNILKYFAIEVLPLWMCIFPLRFTRSRWNHEVLRTFLSQENINIKQTGQYIIYTQNMYIKQDLNTLNPKTKKSTIHVGHEFQMCNRYDVNEGFIYQVSVWRC